MKRGVIFIIMIFLFGILLNSITVTAEEFKSCSQDSDCKVDICNENLCMNQSYSIVEGCNPLYLAAKECRCTNNICGVSIGSVAPRCAADLLGQTYCRDSKTMMTCESPGIYVSKSCVYKCESGQCVEETIIPTTSVPDSGCQSITKCSDGTVSECKIIDNKCVCSTCPAIATPTLPTIQPIQICTDSDNGNFYEKGIMKGATDDAGRTDLCGDYNTLTEYYCENNQARKMAFNCPNGCKDGACLKGESVSEQVTCIFKNSDREQKCYLSEYNSRFFCSGKDNCVMIVQGYKDEKMIWKSTCGSYIPTVIDGQNENAQFECKIGETTTIQIKNKGFRNAYFQCYDGEESKSTEREACKTAEFWKKFASNFCASHCENDPRKCKQNPNESQENIDKCLGKCGVNSFSVTNECYVEEAIAIPTTSINQKPAIATKGMFYYFKGDNCSRCQEMDKEIGILKQKGFFNYFGAAVFDISEKDVVAKYDIKAVPTFIILKENCSFKKEGFMESEEIENWAYESKCGEEIKEVNELIAESILVCKDSCALEGKCYPFGYRKSGKFCSDNGGFAEQLKGELTCDNNFECTSNVCVSGNCISEGLMQKVLNWFKRLFGKE